MIDMRWKTLALAVLPAAMLTVDAAGPAEASARAKAAGAERVISSASAPALTPAARSAGEAAAGPDATTAEALAAYWTAERMRNARPADESSSLRAALRRHEDRAARELRAARSSRGSAPESTGPVGGVAAAAARTSSPAAASARASAYDPGFASNSHPALTSGKVFFTRADGSNRVCSGTVINSEGKNSVWTAGHCVHGGRGGSWHSNWTFVPAYRDGAAPHGYWYARFSTTMTTWINDSDFTSDMAVATMHRRNGWRIADYLGSQGITWNRSKRTAVTALGYPADPPFNGGRLWACGGTTFPEWQVLFWSAETLGLTCDMTGGASGGAWLADFNGSAGRLNGVNSFKYDNDPNTMYSPYFDGTASQLYADTRGQ